MFYQLPSLHAGLSKNTLKLAAMRKQKRSGEKQRLMGIWICIYCNLTIKAGVFMIKKKGGK